MRNARLALVFALVGSGCSYTAARGGGMKDEFYQDFRGPKFPPAAVLGLAGGEGELKSVRREAGGVRVRVAGTESGFPPFGVSPRFRVTGDFEITASFEVVKLDKPATGYGVSVTLWAMMDRPSVDAVGLSRSNRPWDNNVWVANKGWWDAGEKKYHNDGQSTPTACTAGRLRLTRTGSVVHFQAAEGDAQEFQELREVEYGTDDLSQIHLGVDTGGSKGPTEILLKDLRIRADELPLAGATRKPPSRLWLVWLAAGVVGGGLLAGGALFLWIVTRRKKAEAEDEEPAPRPRKPRS